MKFGDNIHVAYRMKPINFGNPVTFPKAPPAGLNVSIAMEYLKIYLVDCPNPSCFKVQYLYKDIQVLA